MGRSKQVLRTYFPNSYSSPSRRSHGSPRVARGGALVWQTSDGLSPYEGWRFASPVYPPRRILRFASSGDRQRRRTARVLRAATHNCVSTRSVCDQLDNVMNVDIFPNADITYDPPPSASAAVIPLLSSRLVIPSR